MDWLGAMKAKTSLLLYHLLWAADSAMRPTFRNLSSSFEEWAYRSGYLAQIQRLEAAGLVESRRTPWNRQRFVRLTDGGRIAALGGRAPEACWNESWDNTWRVVLFDLPEMERALRSKVRRALLGDGCGCLQGSVWISPRMPACVEWLQNDRARDCSHLILLEAKSRGVHEDRAMAAAAWDFKRINALYAAHEKVLARIPRRGDGREALLQWSRDENTAWLKAVRSDPLLPAGLAPSFYAGPSAWKKRLKALRTAAGLAKANFPQQ